MKTDKIIPNPQDFEDLRKPTSKWFVAIGILVMIFLIAYAVATYLSSKG